MANKIFNTRIKNKRDTEANWTSKNPVLLNGEIIVVDTASGETRFKVGDGSKKYSQLPFQDAATLGNYVPTTRKVNSKALSSDISLTASDVGALPSTTTALKNPHALTFTGAVTDSYDGSASKTVAIPSVDMGLDGTSFNPVSNSAVVAGLDEKLDTAGGIVAGIEFVDGVIILPENEPTVSTAAITKGYVDKKIAVHASTSDYGTTKLSNSVSSSSKTLAATPYAVKTALAQAKKYVDRSITAAINASY